MEFINKTVGPNVSLVVVVAFLTQMLPFGNAALAFPSWQPTRQSVTSFSSSCQKTGPAQESSLFLALSERWESLNTGDKDIRKMSPLNDQNGENRIYKGQPGEWKPISAEGQNGKTASPSGKARKAIGRSGGIISSQRGDISVSIPAGALSQDTLISVKTNEYRISFDLAAGSEMNDILTVASCDFGPTGTRFSKPVTVQMAISQEAARRIRNGDRLIIANVNGGVVEYINNYGLDSQDKLRFELNHFSLTFVILGVSAVALVGLIGAGLSFFSNKKPHNFITPKGKNIQRFVNDGSKFNLPKEINQTGWTDLGINKRFTEGDPKKAKYIYSGETIVTWKNDRKVLCGDLSLLTASLLIASKDPRFQNLKVVEGTAVSDGKKDGHMWIEIKMPDGQVYVVDTINPSRIRMLPASTAYEKFSLKPVMEFGYKKVRKKYVGWDGKPGPDAFKNPEKQKSESKDGKAKQDAFQTPESKKRRAAYEHGYDIGCKTAKGEPTTDVKEAYGQYPRGSDLREMFRQGYAQGADNCKMKLK